MCSVNWSDPSIVAAIISIGFALASGVVTAIAFNKKKGIENKFNKELETYKSELDKKNREIQLILDTRLEEVKIEYSNIYSQRLKIIADIYSQLALIEMLMTSRGFVKLNEEQDEAYDRYLVKIIGDCSNFVSLNGIYLNDYIKSKLSILLDNASKQVISQIKDLNVIFTDSFRDILNQIKAEDIRPLLNELRSDFQKLLGIKQ